MTTFFTPVGNSGYSIKSDVLYLWTCFCYKNNKLIRQNINMDKKGLMRKGYKCTKQSY